MTFEPDILVEVPGTTRLLLVVEVKLKARPTEAWRALLFHFMRGRNCTHALLVTLEEVTLVQDHYTGNQPSDLEVQGPLALGTLFADFQGPEDATARGFAFEDRAQAWIEDLAAGHLDSKLPPATRAVLSADLLPYIWGTDVRAGSPRYRVSA